ncbi:hypothetical protein F5Y16DRAFT_34229 [Xylariaceae sp. FL0255]|nr:hypothetical protein F5Y16DRAFT_34229 [Xylariaceae sp. FL0255]
MAQVTTPKANTMGPPNQNNKSGPEPKFLSTLPSPPILPSLPAPAPAPAPDSASTPIQVPSPPTSTTAPTSRTAPLVPPKPSPPCSFNFYIERPSTITHSATGTITVPGAKVPLIAVDQLPSWIEIVGVPRDLQKSINETGPSIIATKTISITGTTTINNTTGTAASTMNPCTTTNDSLFSLTIGAKSLGIVQRSTKPDTYEVRLGKGYQVGLINNTNNTVKERMITNILISPRDRERIRAASASANITTTAVTHAESSGTRQPPPIGLFERLPPPPTPKVAENPYAHIRVRKVSPSSRECYFDANGNIVHRRSRSSSGRRRSGRRGCGSRRKREGKSKEKEMEREWEGDEKRDRRHPAERLREAFDDDIVPPAELRIKGLAREVPGTGGGGDMREIKESQENRTKLLSEDGIEYCRHWCRECTCFFRSLSLSFLYYFLPSGFSLLFTS